jgi:hypothetical protein
MNNLAVQNQESYSNNVVGFDTNTPYARIKNFINSYESENTKKAYTNHFEKMFMYCCHKPMEKLTYSDIKSIDDIKVEDYRNFLQEQYAETSVNQMIFACKALWDRFKERRIVDFNYFDIKPLIEKDNSRGSLTPEEVDGLFNYCLKQDYKPVEQKLYFEFLYTVTCRKSAAQSLTWDKIVKELDVDTSKLVWVCTFIDKGKEVKKAINEEFYDRLKNNYVKEGYNSGKVFNINDKTYDKTLKRFCKEWGISESRNICQHSLKSSSLDLIQSVYRDINITAQSASHKNINTCYRRYINKNRSYCSQPSYSLYKNYSFDMLKDLDRDTLVEIIKNCDKTTLIKLCIEKEKLDNGK